MPNSDDELTNEAPKVANRTVSSARLTLRNAAQTIIGKKERSEAI